jgi:hypothetical protein
VILLTKQAANEARFEVLLLVLIIKNFGTPCADGAKTIMCLFQNYKLPRISNVYGPKRFQYR